MQEPQHRTDPDPAPADMVGQVIVEGKTYHFALGRFLNVELMAVERATGLNAHAFETGAEAGSMIAVTALVWILRKRHEDPALQFDDVIFDVDTLEMGVVPAPGSGQGKAPEPPLPAPPPPAPPSSAPATTGPDSSPPSTTSTGWPPSSTSDSGPGSTTAWSTATG